MGYLIRLIYKLLGIYERVHIMSPKNEILKGNIKISKLPRVGDLLFFEGQSDYYEVIKVIHHIGSKQEIWLVSEALKEKKENNQ